MSIRIASRLAAWAFAGAFTAFNCVPALAVESSVRLIRSAASFDRAGFTAPGAAEEVRAADDLKGTHCCVSGWAEYDFSIVTGGWYELWVRGGVLETLIDPPDIPDGEPAAYFSGGSGLPGDIDKVGNVWLFPGLHRVRVQDYRWYGFSGLRSIELRRSGDSIEGTVSIPWPRAGQIFRAGQCPLFELLTGGRHDEANLVILVQEQDSGALVGRRALRLPASTGLSRYEFEVPCSTQGFYRVSVAEMQGERERNINWRGIKGFSYEVVDARPLSAAPLAFSAEAVLSIDCARQTPDYESGDSAVRQSAVGAYRQSGDTGWMPYQYRPEAERKRAKKPSWFAYALPGVVPGNRYRIEIEYPDDEDRTFAIFLRESEQHAYPVSIGVDTGGPYPVSQAMQMTGMTIWPRAAVPRLLFASPHDGQRAACARIRVLRLTPTEPARAASRETGAREFVYWYEEGLNFIDLFGAAKEEPRQISQAIDRWAGTVAEQGGTTLMPTALVYGGQLYPSRFNLMEMFPDRDPLRRIILSAEHFHLKVIPEVHPRADELTYGKDESAARRLLLLSKDGRDNFFAGDGHTRNFPPYYNVLLPEVQDWLIAMIGELADRYRDSRALEGISLRYMGWSNAALDNLVGLDWGYDDETIRRFQKDTGIAVPSTDAADPARFFKRYGWLTTTGRQAWIAWRCEQITALLRRVARRIQQARPDLKLYLHAMPTDPERPYRLEPGNGPLDTPLTRLREAGLDPQAISNIPGAVIIDSTAAYGRDRPSAVAKGLLEPLRDPRIINALRVQAEGERYLPFHRYIEATDVVVPPEQLGFPKATRATWASVAANRAGRGALERFAVELAEGDALWLGDGGNGYVFSVSGLQEFLSEYTQLPAAPFHTESKAGDSIVVRTRQDAVVWWLYVVNRESMAQCVEVKVSGSGALRRLLDEKLVEQQGRSLFVQLPPYGLFAARARGGYRVISTSMPSTCAAGVK